ncbi:Hypothetical protein TES1_0155 [Thermococcus paralvinellae]|uniref:Lipoprotein n=2 Tax=Thermococcus paralvinellae TaxID=582419 RepID=W0I4A5_9EURY|nr:Hypothetical protein TES1_0155 [Thermococcus paralvinellae]
MKLTRKVIVFLIVITAVVGCIGENNSKSPPLTSQSSQTFSVSVSRNETYKTAYFTVFLYYPGEVKYTSYELKNTGILFKFEQLSGSNSLKLTKIRQLVKFPNGYEDKVQVVVISNGTIKYCNVVRGLGQPTVPPRYIYHASPLNIETIAIILPPENSTVQEINFDNGTLIINCLKNKGTHGKIVSSEIIKEHRKEIFKDRITFHVNYGNKTVKIKGCAIYNGEKAPPLIMPCRGDSGNTK